MKELRIYFSILFIALFQSANATCYNCVDSIVAQYPNSFSTPEKLACKICQDFHSDDERARAIYAWIGKNIRYDVKSYYSPKKHKSYSYKSKEEEIKKEKRFQNKILRQTLKNRSAVCFGYSTLFKKLCDLCDIKCEVIVGGAITKPYQIWKKPFLGAHAWNAVRIDNTWKLIDATWGAGSVDDKRKTFIPQYTDAYFFTNPELFFLNHYPKDSTWTLIKKSKADFIKQPLYFTKYLQAGIERITPNIGVIAVGFKDSIDFKIANAEYRNLMSYAFSKEKYSHSIKPTVCKNNDFEFQVENILKNDGYLTLFLDGEPMVTFKIKIKTNPPANSNTRKPGFSASLRGK